MVKLEIKSMIESQEQIKFVPAALYNSIDSCKAGFSHTFCLNYALGGGGREARGNLGGGLRAC